MFTRIILVTSIYSSGVCMQQTEKEIHWSVIVAYLVSVGLAAALSKAFYVLSTGQIGLIACVLFAPIGIIRMYQSPRLAFGLGHVVAAVALHPVVWLDMEKARPAHMKIKMAHALNQAGGDDWHSLANTALDLTHAIQADVLFRMKLLRPGLFWLYPLSVVLVAWGLFAFFKPEAKRAA